MVRSPLISSHVFFGHWVKVGEIDAVFFNIFAITALENSHNALDFLALLSVCLLVFFLFLFIIFFCEWLKLSVKLQLEFSLGDFVLSFVFFKLSYKDKEVGQGFTSGKESGLLLDVNIVVRDLQAFPWICLIFIRIDLFTIICFASIFHWVDLFTFFSLVLSLFMSVLINDRLPCFEVSLNLIQRGNRAIEPRMGNHLVDVQSVGWLKSHHFAKKVLEFG